MPEKINIYFNARQMTYRFNLLKRKVRALQGHSAR